MQLGIYLVRQGAISADALVTALEHWITCRPPIGQLAIESHKLSMKQVFEILQVQADSSEPFGRIAVNLQFLSKDDVEELLQLQRERTPTLAQTLVDSGILDEEELATQVRNYYTASLTRLDLGLEAIESDRALRVAAHETANEAPAKASSARRTPRRRKTSQAANAASQQEPTRPAKKRRKPVAR